MTPYILIVMCWLSGAPVVVTMQEFSTGESCHNAEVAITGAAENMYRKNSVFAFCIQR
jgi:hypothetical protein